MKHNVWVAADGSWGSSPFVLIELTDSEAEVMHTLSDNDRVEVAWMVSDGHSFSTALCLNKGSHDSGDNPVDENGEAACQDCGTMVNSDPDLG